MAEILGLIADVNPNEIAAHIADGTLADWCELWRQQATHRRKEDGGNERK